MRKTLFFGVEDGLINFQIWEGTSTDGVMAFEPTPEGQRDMKAALKVATSSEEVDAAYFTSSCDFPGEYGLADDFDVRGWIDAATDWI